MPVIDCKPLPVFSVKEIQRFYSNIDRSPGQGPRGDCHAWVGSRFVNGYGRFKSKGRTMKSSRIGLMLCTGEDPYPLVVCHTCDWPPCNNEDHLFSGTVLANNQDRNKKGRAATGDRSGSRLHPERLARGVRNGLRVHPERAPMGERNRHAKLTDEQVKEIHRRYALGGVSYIELAREFNLTGANVSFIVRRLTWKNVLD